MTLRARLTLSAALAVAAAVIIASIGVYFVVRSELRGEVDESLASAPAVIERKPFEAGVSAHSATRVGRARRLRAARRSRREHAKAARVHARAAGGRAHTGGRHRRTRRVPRGRHGLREGRPNDRRPVRRRARAADRTPTGRGERRARSSALDPARYRHRRQRPGCPARPCRRAVRARARPAG